MWITLLMLGLAFSLPNLVVPAWVAIRLQPTPPAWEQARARLSAERPRPGTDAFDALFLLEFAVPPDRRRALVDADLANPDLRRAGEAARAAGMPSVATGARQLLDVCESGADCIATVAAAQHRVGVGLSRLEGLSRNLAELRAHGHVRDRPGRPAASAWPSMAPRIAAIGHALAFVEGDRDGALAGACTDIAFWRGLVSNSSSVAATGLAMRSMDAHVGVLAGALRRMPRGTPLPPTCTQAMRAPDGAAGSLGPGPEALFRGFDDAMTAGVAASPWPWSWLVLDLPAARARVAARVEQVASPRALADLRTDRTLPEPSLYSSALDWRCVADHAGCVAAEVSGMTAYVWMMQMQDHRASLQLLSALAWLQAQPPSDEPLPSLLARWPGQWPAPARQVRANAVGHLAIERRWTGGDATLPSPGSRVEAATRDTVDDAWVAATRARILRDLDAARARAERERRRSD